MKAKRSLFRSPALFGSPLKYGAPVFVGFCVFITGLDAHGGDMLRGGGRSAGGPPAKGGTVSGAGTPAATDAARANARDILSRTNRTRDSLRAMQEAARLAARTNGINNLGKNPRNSTVNLPDVPDVPNGLGTGGLKVSSTVTTDPTKWKGAELPAQTVSGEKTTVTIKQTEQQAVLNWESFNIGKKTTLTFDQSAGGADVSKWIAFNKINDPSGNPTQILGNIKADGQVYIINPNGVIFGGSSQVNARNLTVSSLPINDNLIGRGLLNNPDAQFLFSGLDLPVGLNGTPAFTPDRPLSADGKYGDVIVEAGAILESPANAAKVGGRIVLVGPNVTNAGTISTPDGQTIIAAGLQVGFNSHPGSDPSLRGLDAFVGSVTDPIAGAYAGNVTHLGLIESFRGGITLTGREINQFGVLDSTTSVALNGRIDLQANYNALTNPNYNPANTAGGDPFIYQTSGTVTLGQGSITRILPEYDSKETVIGTELALRSQINLVGKAIHLDENSILFAPNAIVNIKAGEWIFEGAAGIFNFIQSTGQVYLDHGTLVDVSGSANVSVPVSQNIISVDLRGAELADSPLQREGVLRGVTVQVDIRDQAIYKSEMWTGTALADLSGFANLIQKSVGQLTVAGGSVNISAGSSVVMQGGAKIDVSGGSIQFAGGLVKTTQLIKNGRIVDISEATPDMIYDGIYDGMYTESNPKFGVSNSFQSPLAPNGIRYEAASIQGGDGGSLSIVSPGMALDGILVGKTIVGERQRTAPPHDSSLAISFLAKDKTYLSLPDFSPTPPRVVFVNESSLPEAAAFAVDVDGNPLPLDVSRLETVELSPDLIMEGGFGILDLNNRDGSISVAEGVSLNLPGGSISFNASNINIDGSITAASGKLSFTSANLPLEIVNVLNNTTVLEAPLPLAGRGVFSLGSTGKISTAGLLVDDRLQTPGSGLGPVFIDGGSISINAFTAELGSGGLLDVSGGALLYPDGHIDYGAGGSLSISAGRDTAVKAVLGGKLVLGATMAGYSGGTAGSLSIGAPAIQIGGSTTNSGITRLDESFFNQGGFGTFSLTSTGLASETPGEFVTGIRISSGTHIHPVVTSLAADTSDGGFILRQVIQEEGLRPAGSLSFTAFGGINNFTGAILGRGDLIHEEGTSILMDAKGSVSLRGETVSLHGSVITPGGSITVAGEQRFPSLDPTVYLPTTLIGKSALLSAAGKTLLVSNPFGLRQGEVLSGGSITIAGNIVAEKGAVFDVSGTSGVLDLPPAAGFLEPSGANGRLKYVPVEIHSNGGSITLSGSKMLYSDATLVGHSGGSSAIGGSVTVSSGKFVLPEVEFTSAEANLIVRQNGTLLPEDFVSRGIGAALTDASGNPLAGIGNFTVSTFSSGGFDSLSLSGNVKFEGDVTIRTPGSLRVSSGGVIYSTGSVKLDSSYVKLGQAFLAPTLPQDDVFIFTQTDTAGSVLPYDLAPTHGTGSLVVRASNLIDIGNLSLQGLGNAGFTASDGDIRGNGTLSAAGKLEFKAGQIYPTTAGEFDIFAHDYSIGGKLREGSVTILGGANRQLPYSSGGKLGVYASQISQGGTLRAPIGTIRIGWDGNGSAPLDKIAGATAPAPVTQTLTLASGGVVSVSAVDPVTGKGLVIPYGISIDGNSWIDPAGNDITVEGVPGKSVILEGADLVTEQGSSVDIGSGGDLYAYRWVSGNGGTKDVLATSTGFAVIPGYSLPYAPYAAFNTSAAATNLNGQVGYVNSSLKVGDQITLAAAPGLPAGTYTLLPARYALLPGAFLVTPKTEIATGTAIGPGGVSTVSGYRSNGLDASRVGPTTIARFEVAPSSVVRKRSEYQDFLANTVLRDAAIARGFAVPRLPVDAGYLSFSSTTGMKLQGRVASAVSKDGRGSVIDINSAANILINNSGTGGNEGDLVFSSRLLNSFGAESLLIGGVRSFGPDGSSITVNTANVTLDNAGSALTGEDVILVAKEELQLQAGSMITATGDDTTLDSLLLGDSEIPGSGNGVLVRVSGNKDSRVFRTGVNSSSIPNLIVGGNTQLTGGGIILDSTFGTQLDATASIQGGFVSLRSGQIGIRLRNSGNPIASSGLVLSGDALDGLQKSTRALSLLSYSSLDIYGTGTVGSRAFESLTLEAPLIRGLNTGDGSVTFSAKKILIANPTGIESSLPHASSLNGDLIFDADQITLDANNVRVDGFSDIRFVSDDRLLVSGSGSFSAAGSVNLITPLVTGESSAKYRIAADGLLRLSRPASASGTLLVGGLGADLTLEGRSVSVNSGISLPSGSLLLRATSGDVVVGDLQSTRIDLRGTETRILDVTRYTNGGSVNLVSDHGSVLVREFAEISVAANNNGGNAGNIVVKSPDGNFLLEGSINGSGGDNGRNGSFFLDVSSIPGESLSSLDVILNAGEFTHLRDYRIRNGSVNIDGLVTSLVYRVSADSGDIKVSSIINASGDTGGTIDLKAHGNLVLENGALLDAAGERFDAAGKGGAVILEAGTQRGGITDATARLELKSGSTIDLSVAAADTASESLGQFSGTLHLRAPRNATNSDLHIKSIGSSIIGASSILVEGVKLYGVTGLGAIDSSLQTSIFNDANDFLGSSGTASAAYTAMLDRLTLTQPDLDLILAPGVEIYNLDGSITLGSASSTSSSDWNLSSFRFGPRKAAGVLTLRASENLTFFNALSDGFSGGVGGGFTGTTTSLWQAILIENNPDLKANSQSWSFRLTSGADLSASSHRAVLSQDSLEAGSGLLQLGKDAGAAGVVGGTFALTSSIIGNLYQVIRTGSGDIDINTGRSLQLLNPFASIYTAGTRVADPKTISTTNDFVVPVVSPSISQGNLGVQQQAYIAQYSMAGGNVSITSGENIERKTRNNFGLIDDSSRQLPNNWLYRRGIIGKDGTYGKVLIGSGLTATSDPAASTSWWVDFSNFFMDVGALGGGNVSLSAANHVSNIDASIPTNARSAMGTPSAGSFIELGGGDLRVKSGGDISGGVYYVERGHGTLEAGGAITTNGTRSPSFGLAANLNDPDAARFDPLTWMPTTLFVGKSSFDLTSSEDLLLGPVSNPFLLPQGLNNRYWYKTYFSTISADSAITALSLGGDVSFRNAVTLPDQGRAQPMLRAWHESQLLLTGSASSTAWLQPWLRLAETGLDPFSPVWSLSASSVSMVALAGDINLTGNLTLNPSARGQLEIVATGSINALQPSGLSRLLVQNQSVQSWLPSTINLSDADPDSIPSVLTPLTSFTVTDNGAATSSQTGVDFMDALIGLFLETGSVTGTNAVLQTRQARHTPGDLHLGDSEPMRVYALNGDLSGLTLYSPKAARIFAGTDLTDVSFYIQNLSIADTSVVSAGRDITAINASSPLRVAAISEGNALSESDSTVAGDIQISGPGTLEVLAGRNLDLGIGASNSDGTGTGISSIGNLRNPYLPITGADLIVGAGIGASSSLTSSQLAIDAFITKFIETPDGEAYLEEIAPGIEFSTQSEEKQAQLAIEVFYRILRQTGRDFNDPESDGYRNYEVGFEAIKTLFPEETAWDGEILTQGRDIRTRSGGEINIIAPGGGLKMAETTLGNPLTPPGIITESGGQVSLFTDQSVNIGIGRIFTLRSGNVLIWSSKGDIAAGSSSRTIQSAPPTRVVVDPQSASVETDLAGLATGGGIGVLATVEGVKPGDVDLIAPVGIIDAGDAGIRVSGNINLAALQINNAANISAGGTSTGAPSTTVSAPSLSLVTSASTAGGAINEAINNAEPKTSNDPIPTDTEATSLFTVDVIGYGIASEEEEKEEDNSNPSSNTGSPP